MSHKLEGFWNGGQVLASHIDWRDPGIPNFQEVKFFSYRMPGHIKKSTGPDPDPSPWLKVSDEFRDRNKSKPYDAKKSCWVPNANKVLDIPDLTKHSLCLDPAFLMTTFCPGRGWLPGGPL